MNTCHVLPAPIPLQRPLWQRAAEFVAVAWSAWRESWRVQQGQDAEPMDLQLAASLNDHLLRDIGVSETLRDQVAVRRGLDAMAARVAMNDFAERGRHWYG
jgi:hypothetical protein